MTRNLEIINDNVRVINDNVNILNTNVKIINDNIGALGNQVSGVENYVNHVANSVNNVENRVSGVEGKVDEILSELRTFIRADRLAKSLQLAETKIIQVRQELESKFGQNKVVRKNAIGILQGIDAKIIRKETIQSNTETMMLNTPGYWLAPALVALSAWISDDKQLAERALSEAIKRDDEKTSLFFTLVNRRLERYEASDLWLKRYIEMQNPKALTKDMTVVLDAYANGLFAYGSTNECHSKINEWIKELSEEDGFIDEQRERWKHVLGINITEVDLSSYEYMNKYGSNFTDFAEAMKNSTIHQNLFEYFKEIFDGELETAKSAAEALDNLLNNLVSEYDSGEESKLKLEEERLTCIIEEKGDEEKAESIYNIKKSAVEEYVNFAELLTNSAMFAEKTKASKATQRLAVALSKEWIVESYRDKIAENRLNFPAQFIFELEDWIGKSIDGSNEKELITDYISYTSDREKYELDEVKLNPLNYIKLAVAAVLPFIKVAVKGRIVLVIAALGLVAWFYMDYKMVQEAKENIKQKFNKLRKSGGGLIKAILAELTDFRRKYDESEEYSENTLDYLENIEQNQFKYNNYDNTRKIL